MSTIRRSEDGYTIIEILVAMSVFAVISIGFYSVMLAGTRSSRTSESVARVSEEARLGLNRMIRDTREGQLFSNLDPDRFHVAIDFDGDGNSAENPNGDGDYENLEYRFVGDEITLNGETLVAGVSQVTTCATPPCPVFTYTSNDLRYDMDGDGITTRDDLLVAQANGFDVNPDDPEIYSNVQFAFRVTVEDRSMDFQGQAQLRNRREIIQ